MIAELRWILLGLSLVLLAGIWWWGARRSAQAPGNAELRESTAIEPQRLEIPAPDSEPTFETEISAPTREWGVPPFEPLSIRTADYDRVPVLDGPMMVNADPMSGVVKAPRAMPAKPAPMPQPVPVISRQVPTLSAEPGAMSTGFVAVAPAGAASAAARVPVLASEGTDRIAVASAPAVNVSEKQKIVSVRVCAPGEERWSGSQLLAALELHSLAFGRYQVFHRNHVDGRSLFCVASLIEPGTFDVAGMPMQEFRGVTFFAVLPGPLEPLLTVDELLTAAGGLATELSGVLQDAKGVALSAQRAAALRDDVARFQASLPGV